MLRPSRLFFAGNPPQQSADERDQRRGGGGGVQEDVAVLSVKALNLADLDVPAAYFSLEDGGAPLDFTRRRDKGRDSAVCGANQRDPQLDGALNLHHKVLFHPQVETINPLNELRFDQNQNYQKYILQQ